MSINAARGTRARWRRPTAVAAVLAVLALVVTVPVAVHIDRYGQVERGGGPAPVIVVLGSRVLEGGIPSPPLQARVEKAVALWQEGRAPRLLFSGGVGRFPPAEAEVARALAMRLGVPADVCDVEAGSHTTEQNARLSAAMLRAAGVREVLLVSDPYHLFRAERWFRRAGIVAHPSPALASERNARWYERVYWTLREAVAVIAHPEIW